MATKPKRIQRKRSKGWKMPANTVYVGRPGPWGNPFVVGVQGSQAKCVELFRMLLSGHIALGYGIVEEQEKYYEYAKKHIHELRGKNLACWCREGAPCHGDVLLAAANQLKPLFIPLRAVHYDAFASGDKREELRPYGPRWNEKTCHVGREVILSRGYGKQHRLRGVIWRFFKQHGSLFGSNYKADIQSCYGTLDMDIACIGIKYLKAEVA